MTDAPPVRTWERRAEAVADRLRERGLGRADVLCVLGSGLGGFVERLEDPLDCPYEDVPDLPRSTVPGHAGRFVLGRLGTRRVLCQQGRVHLYEGWNGCEITLAVRAVARLGVPVALFTNAAGGLRPEWPPGSLMRITDHIDRQGATPLFRGEGGRGHPWDAGLGGALERAAASAGLALEHGVYAALPGPSYETPAEIRYLAEFGADAVGMSTVQEAKAAHAAGMRVAGVSCITNFAAGIAPGALSHEEVIEVGAQAAERFGELLAACVDALG